MLQAILATLNPGDTLVIRVQTLQCAEQLLNRQVDLVTLDGRINTDTMRRDVVKLLVGVMGYAADVERKAILKRTAEDRAVALENVVKMGRKSSCVKGLGYGTIGTKLGITARKVRRIQNSMAKLA